MAVIQKDRDWKFILRQLINIGIESQIAISYVEGLKNLEEEERWQKGEGLRTARELEFTV